jgi:hypothetical protein
MEITLKFDLFIGALRSVAKLWASSVIIDRESAIAACHSGKSLVFDCDADNRYIIISNTLNDSCSYGVLSTLDFLLGGDWAELPKCYFDCQQILVTLSEALKTPTSYLYDTSNWRIVKRPSHGYNIPGVWKFYEHLDKHDLAEFVRRGV